MCLDPLKGWLHNNHIVKVTKKDVTAVYWHNDSWQLWKGDVGQCTYPLVLSQYTDLPCRHCAECYEQNRKEWITRAVAESLDHDKMCFLTLTYDDAHVHWSEVVDDDGVMYKHTTLFYRDFQLFMKSLRKAYPDNRIRYMVCGEYGTHTYRPHYHAIIYGLSLADIKDAVLFKVNLDNPLYVSEQITDMWSHGFVSIGECNIKTVAYVAGYVCKKSTTIKPKKFYETTGITPPFIKSSNKPGLGARKLSELRDSFDDVHDYKKVFTGLDSDPIKLRLTPWYKRQFDDLHGYDPYAVSNDYRDKKDAYRADFYDHSMDLLLRDSDMSIDDYREQKTALANDQARRKRGF